MQREHLHELQVGDFIQLPAGEWHKNHAAQAIYASAQALMAAHSGEGERPQYQVENEDQYRARLVRLR